MGCWELKQGPLEEQPVLNLQPPVVFESRSHYASLTNLELLCGLCGASNSRVTLVFIQKRMASCSSYGREDGHATITQDLKVAKVHGNVRKKSRNCMHKST